MTVRKVGASDLSALEAFLIAHIDGSMFPLSNLRRHGLAMSDHPRSMSFWVSTRGDDITGAVGISREGYLFPQTPQPEPELLAAVRSAIVGRPLHGLLGPLPHVHALRSALGLDGAALQHSGDEPHYALELSDLKPPPALGLNLVRPDPTHSAVMVTMRGHYAEEVLGLDPDKARKKAEADIADYLEADSHRLLVRDGVPVAMTGFNAVMPEVVQIGGVFTPPELRGQGLARAAVALHLAEARETGVRRAVLFAASSNAARAYEAIGFQRIGDFSMSIFRTPQVAPPCPV